MDVMYYDQDMISKLFSGGVIHRVINDEVTLARLWRGGLFSFPSGTPFADCGAKASVCKAHCPFQVPFSNHPSHDLSGFRAVPDDSSASFKSRCKMGAMQKSDRGFRTSRRTTETILVALILLNVKFYYT
jgi:hypothetical protein